MKKIRINELARELEVKPNVILDMLPELGVEEKKTHSSSIDEDVALAIRKRLGYDVPSGNGAHAAAEAEPVVERKPAPEVPAAQEAAVVPEEEAPVSGPVAEPPAFPAAPAEEHPTPVRSPLRPPLAAGPRAPITPPLRGAQTSSAMPVRPQQPAAPRAPEARPAAPAGVITAPPGPKPGQILTGPRAPLRVDIPRPTVIQPGAPQHPRATGATPGAPRPAAPAMPAAPRARVQPSAPAGPGQQAPAAPRASARQNLVGQPAARPVVPPNPAVLERLRQQQTQPKAMPGQPSPPPARPGVPRPAGLVP